MQIGTANMPLHQPSNNCNAHKSLSPQQRAVICAAIHRELALEYFCRTNRKREAWARMAIGLPPFKRRIEARR
jgi:hypothetical protein